MRGKRKEFNEPLKDVILVELIKDVERKEKAPNTAKDKQCVNIVININGTLIEGELISYDTFWRQFNLEFSEKIEGSDEKQLNVEDRYFIHLRNARFKVSSGISIPVSETGLLWRGRLSSVDGFSVGNLQAGKTTDNGLAGRYIAPYKE